MQPWLSGSVLRCGIVLSLGWVSLAAVVVATSGTMAGEPVAGLSRPAPVTALQLDQADPCTHESIVVNAQLFVRPTAYVDVDVIASDLLVTVVGVVQSGPNRTEHSVGVETHHRFIRALQIGPLESTMALLRLLEHQSQPSTLLAVGVQPVWNGTDETVTVTETHLLCE